MNIRIDRTKCPKDCPARKHECRHDFISCPPSLENKKKYYELASRCPQQAVKVWD